MVDEELAVTRPSLRQAAGALVRLPVTVTGSLPELLATAERFVREFEQARRELQRTRSEVATANRRLAELIELSQVAVARMTDAMADVAAADRRLRELMPLAEQATDRLVAITRALDQVPFIDAE